MPIDAGIVPGQPRKAQHQLEVRQPGDWNGETLRVGGVNTQAGGEIVVIRTVLGLLPSMSSKGMG